MKKENRRSFKTILLMPRVQLKFVGIVAILVGTLPTLSLAQKEQLEIQLKRIPQASCLTSDCHSDKDKGPFVHGPVRAKGCTVCHIPASEPNLVKGKKEVFTKLPKDHPPLFKTDKPHIEATCFLCHDDFEDLFKKAKSIHSDKKQGCVSCHNPHGSKYKFFLSAANLTEACRKCHENDEIAKNPHKPFAEGKCDLCHVSHSSNFRYLLINNQRQLCFSCHEDTKAELERFKYIHKPVVDRDCGVCHAPHESDYFRLLIKGYSPEFYAPFDVSNYDLCFSCHQADKVLVKETENFTDFRNGKRNLHFLHVNNPKRGRTCRTCHATHASDEPKHLRKTVPYGGWEIPIKFTKTETGGNCAPGCHDRRGYDRVNPEVYLSDTNQAASTSRGDGGTPGGPEDSRLR